MQAAILAGSWLEQTSRQFSPCGVAAAVQAEVEEPVKVAFVDQGYTGENPKEMAAQHGVELLVVKHHEAKR